MKGFSAQLRALRLPGILLLLWPFGGDLAAKEVDNALADLNTPAVQVFLLPEEQPNYDLPLFLEEEGGSPRLEFIQGSLIAEDEALRDQQTLDAFLSQPPQPAPAGVNLALFADDADPVPPAPPEPDPVKLVFTVPDYLRDMTDAMAAVSLQSVLTSFMIFNTTARLYEEGLYTREEALRVTETYLNLLDVSRGKLRRLQAREPGPERSPTSRFLTAMDALDKQGQALRAWALDGGYTPDPDYARAEDAARQAINRIVAAPPGAAGPTPGSKTTLSVENAAQNRE
jgi:hypothetical protein